MSRRWKLMAHMAVNAKVNGKEHQEVLFASYLQQAYEAGIADANPAITEALEFYARVGVPKGCTPVESSLDKDPYWQDQGKRARAALGWGKNAT